jgi:hypothetical protein
MFTLANRLTAEKAAYEQHFIDGEEDRWKGGIPNLRIGTLVTIKHNCHHPNDW